MKSNLKNEENRNMISLYDFFIRLRWLMIWCCDTLLKQTTCLVAGCGLRNSLSLVSLPQLELSLISVVNFRDARGLAGAALLWLPTARPAFLEHTCDWICSQTLRNLRMLPAQQFFFKTIIFILYIASSFSPEYTNSWLDFFSQVCE